MSQRNYLCLALSLLCLAIGPSQVLAHGLSWQQDFNPTITLNFVFADGEPLAYGAVSIFAPDDLEFEYQKGRSDQNGFFSFRPNQSGTWKFSAVDGQGHKTSGQLELSPVFFKDQGREALANGQAQSEPTSKAYARPDLKSLFLGLSLILNLALLTWWRCQKGLTLR